MTPTDPITTGEVVRRLDRMEATIMSRLDQHSQEFVSHQLYSAHSQLQDQKISEIKDDLEDLTVTRRQILIGGTLIVLGEIAALTIGLINFLPTGAITP